MRGSRAHEDTFPTLTHDLSSPRFFAHACSYVGLDTTFNVLKNWHEAFPNEPAFFIPKSLAAKVAAGQLGRKTGQGYYAWQGNKVVEDGKGK